MSFNPGAMRVTLQDGELEHVQLQAGRFIGQVAHTMGQDVCIDWGRYNLAIMAKGQLCCDRVTMGVLLDGVGDWRFFGGAAANGDLMALPERSELLMSLPQGAQWFSLQVAPERLDVVGLSLRSLRERGRWRLGATTGLPQLLSTLAPMLAPESERVPRAPAQLLQAQEDALAVMLSAVAQHLDGPVSSRGGGDAGDRLRVVRRAEEWLAGYHEPVVRIDDLCRAACTSLSRLERSFRDVFGVGPRRYLTMRRLASVRRELLACNGRDSVTSVATRWGFFHLGRFAKEYSHFYHELPSQTLRGQTAS